MREIGIQELMFNAHNYSGIPTPGAGTKADMNWFDDFCNSYRQGDTVHCEKYAMNYWMRYPHKSGNCRWEYLIDGVIEVVGGLDDLRDALNEHDELA